MYKRVCEVKIYRVLVEEGIGRGELPNNRLQNMMVTLRTEGVQQMAKWGRYHLKSSNPMHREQVDTTTNT